MLVGAARERNQACKVVYKSRRSVVIARRLKITPRIRLQHVLIDSCTKRESSGIISLDSSLTVAAYAVQRAALSTPASTHHPVKHQRCMAASNLEMQTVVGKYLQQVNIASVTGALQNFWAAKLATSSYKYRGAPSTPRERTGPRAKPQTSTNGSYPSASAASSYKFAEVNYQQLDEPDRYDDALITYETEHVNVGADQRYIAYVILPGGACFGSPESKRSGAEARKAAAMVALYNSLANEHPYRIVTQTFVAQSLALASKNPAGGSLDSVETYRLVLERNLGRSMLELQEFMCAFRLLSWAGIIERLRAAGFSKERLMAEYADCVLDDTFRSNMCLAWMSRLERDRDASIKLYGEFLKCEADLHDARHKVAELRFEKEKRDIIRLAYSQFNRDTIASSRMLYASNFAIV